MAKRDLLRRKVEDIDVSPSSEVARLVEAMGRGGGFTAKKIAVGVEILRTMFRRPARRKPSIAALVGVEEPHSRCRARDFRWGGRVPALVVLAGAQGVCD